MWCEGLEDGPNRTWKVRRGDGEEKILRAGSAAFLVVEPIVGFHRDV